DVAADVERRTHLVGDRDEQPDQQHREQRDDEGVHEASHQATLPPLPPPPFPPTSAPTLGFNPLPPPPGARPSDRRRGAGTGGALPSTGTDAPLAAVGLAVVTLLAGVLALALRRRLRSRTPTA